ncbi:hypothetical protein [Paraburkholderia kururiensis]|uniref:Outer membrane protein beta-barrel domain-containing protein n=1 Tax=Paraburkholderia kururiensis TaxID=984307 RepID=A0ABZ0WDY6_9BURK|nr:hypothetical protein [Paraburkholderia kururiensis]WQD75551.1 hypothetical protein U0042_15425 [Paraburkholderia kururiensis]
MKILIKLAAVAIGGAFCAGHAAAQEIYLQGGTQGGGAGLAVGVTNWLGLHADVNGFAFNHSFNAGGNEFNGHLRILHGGGYLDLFPFASSSFRLTGGLLLDADRLQGNAVPTNGTFSLNGKAYPALPGAYANATVKYPVAMPYLGIGFGHKPTSKGFGLVADVGVAYGRPRVDFSVSPDLQALADGDIQREEQKIRDSVQRYRFYPIVQIGASYRF